MRSLVVISLVANLLLSGAVLKRHLAEKNRTNVRGAGLPSEVTNRQLRVGRQWVVPPVQAPAPVTIEVTEPFHWAQLESQDYREYVANLRAIGCPEATIRDIISADVRDLYARRIKELIASETARFWDLLADKEAFEKIVDEKHKQLNQLDDEQSELLEALIGVSGGRVVSDEAHAEALQAEAGRAALDFLNPATTRQVLALEQKYRALEIRLGAGSPSGGPEKLSRADFEARRQELRVQKDRELASLLTPSELEEYRLRRSPVLESVRKLAGFGASETELKQMVQLRERQAERSREIAQEKNVDERARLTATAQAQSREELKSLLGDQRFAEYERASDFRYQQGYAFVNRQGLAPETAAQVYELEKAAQQQGLKIRGNPSLQGDAREQALASLREELRTSVTRVLGENADVFFDQHGFRF